MSYPLGLGHLVILILLMEILLLQINVRQMFLIVSWDIYLVVNFYVS